MAGAGVQPLVCVCWYVRAGMCWLVFARGLELVGEVAGQGVKGVEGEDEGVGQGVEGESEAGSDGDGDSLYTSMWGWWCEGTGMRVRVGGCMVRWG